MPVSGDFYYSLHGAKHLTTPPVILIHGAGGTGLFWPPELRRLEGYRVYAPDLPGHGKSQARDGQQSIAGYARQLLEWLDAIDVRRAVFVGHSMGGAIALALGIHHPERVLGLGLLGSGARLRVHPLILEKAASPLKLNAAITAIVEHSFRPAAPARLVELAQKRMGEVRQSVFYGDLLACNTFDVMGRSREIHAPSLVLCGKEDQLAPVRYSQYLADTIPGARLVVIPDAGHMLMLEQQRAVADELLDFLSTIEYNPGEAQ